MDGSVLAGAPLDEPAQPGAFRVVLLVDFPDQGDGEAGDRYRWFACGEPGGVGVGVSGVARDGGDDVGGAEGIDDSGEVADGGNGLPHQALRFEQPVDETPLGVV